jgi:hypothetical protein
MEIKNRKECRSRPERWISRFLGLGMVAALTVVVLWVAYGSWARKNAAANFVKGFGPLDVAAYKLPAVSKKSNRALSFIGAAAEMRLSPDENLYIRELMASKDLVAEIIEDTSLRGFLESKRGALELAYTASLLEKSSFSLAGIERYGNDIMVLSRLLTVHALAALAEDDFEASSASIVVLGRLASALQQEPRWIHVRIGIAVEARQLFVLRAFLRRPDLPRQLLESLVDSLVEVDVNATFRRNVGFQVADFVESEENWEKDWLDMSGFERRTIRLWRDCIVTRQLEQAHYHLRAFHLPFSEILQYVKSGAWQSGAGSRVCRLLIKEQISFSRKLIDYRMLEALRGTASRAFAIRLGQKEITEDDYGSDGNTVPSRNGLSVSENGEGCVVLHLKAIREYYQESRPGAHGWRLALFEWPVSTSSPGCTSESDEVR